jgi:transcriptional regulator with PAS, ATPase and Fis domain
LPEESRQQGLGVPESATLDKLIGRSPSLVRLREQIRCISRSPVPVLIVGETGTGKELCAQAIAQLSGRGPFVPVNCAAFADGLIESELFGHERGAFTGAIRSHPGVIALANGGTLFIDELAEVPAATQVKLLRTLESGEYRPLGSAKTLRSDFRILAATNSGVEGALASGRLRADLLHRLGAMRLRLSPLRERVEDIPLLADAFLQDYRERAREGPRALSSDAYVLLMQHSWPGNVRELRNVVEASAAVAGLEDAIGMEHVVQFLTAFATAAQADSYPTLAEARARAERRAIVEALQRAGGNRERAAKLLRISEATLYRKLGAKSRAKSA